MSAPSEASAPDPSELVPLNVRVPRSVRDGYRIRSVHEDRPMQAIITDVLVAGLGDDPAGRKPAT